MTSEPVKCPCCGQVTAPTDTVRVDLDVNRLYFGDRNVELVPRLAEVAHILSRRMPALVLHETIIGEMWGPQLNVNVAISTLRKLLKPLGIQIVNVWGKGFRMTADLSRSERLTQTEASYAHA